jgi:starch synthase
MPRRASIEHAARPTKALSILMVMSEANPFGKTGGLADVGGALPRAVGRLGHRTTLVLPRYRGAESAGAPVDRFALTLGSGTRDVGFFEQFVDPGVRVILVDAPELFDREGLYGIGSDDYPDNAYRFAFLSRAALEFARRHAERPDVVHVHDWQTGLIPVYMKTLYASDPVLSGVPTVCTIHNLAFQGLFGPEWLRRLDLAPDLYSPDALEYWGRISFLKAGILFSEYVTTVSRRYAREILTPEFGFGFDGILQRRRDRLTGILNGIDTAQWNPADDAHLPMPFDADDLRGKLEAKRAVLQLFGLPAEGEGLERPLIGLVSRLVDQKGFDLLAAVSGELPRLRAAFIALGTGDSRYERLWLDLASRYPDRFAAHIGFDERRAHLIEGGADMFLMPSRFEPCGLNQMYSLRYGTVPIVRATGGLDDTVQNYSERTGQGTGFKFREYDARVLLRTLKRAIDVFDRKKDWRALQRAGMRQDFSWDVSAREYVKVYRRAVKTAGASRRLPDRAPIAAG